MRCIACNKILLDGEQKFNKDLGHDDIMCYKCRPRNTIGDLHEFDTAELKILQPKTIEDENDLDMMQYLEYNNIE